jgi:hypothetical protein
MNIIERVKNILLTPKTEWEIINNETATPQTLLMTYVLPLSIVAAAGSLLQGVLFPGVSTLVFFIVTAAIAFIVQVVTFYLSAYIIDALAPSFGSEKDLNKSAQLVAYSWTPSYIAALLSFIPVLGMLLSLAAWVYGIYLMYLGIGPLKKTPEDKKIGYLVVSYLVIIVVYFVLAAILGLILFATFGIAAGAGRFGR